MQVANPSVRANAAAILFDAFPLQDSDANAAQTDQLMQRQFDVIGVSIVETGHWKLVVVGPMNCWYQT